MLLRLAEIFPQGFWRTIAGSVFLRGLGTLFAFMVGVLLARYLGVDGYGVYALWMTTVSITAVVAQFGLAPLAMRELARFVGYNLVKTQIRWFVRSVVLSVAAVVSAVALYLGTFSDIHSLSGPSTIFFVCLLAAIIGINNVFGAMLRGAQLVIRGQLPDALIRPSAFLVFLLFFLISGDTLSPERAIGFQALAALLALIFSIAMVNSLYRQSTLESERDWKPKGLATAALPIWLADIVRVLNSAYPILILAFLMDDGSAGIYKVAASCSLVLGMPATIMNLAAGPYLARIFANEGAGAVQQLHAKIAWVLFLLMVLAVIFVAIFGQDFISLVFGEEYSDAAIPLLILAVSHLVVSFFGVSSTMMIILGGQKEMFYSYVVGVTTAVLFAIWAIPHYGILGVAYAEVLMVTLLNSVVWLICARRYRCDLSLFGVTRLSVSAQR